METKSEQKEASIGCNFDKTNETTQSEHNNEGASPLSIQAKDELH